MTGFAGLVPLSWTLAFFAALGLAVGSFLNVVVYRVPAGLSIISPPSACPACRHEVRAFDNVPVVSWLVLRGRCRDCASPISWRYPAVEAFTGALFAFTAWRIQEPTLLLAVLVVAGAGVALALIDLDHGRLPFAITGVAGGLVALVLVSGALLGGPVPSVSTVLISVAAWFGVYGGLWFLTSGRGMGLGDVVLSPVLGLTLGALGLSESLVGLGAGFALGAVAGIAVVVVTGARGRMPHGPAMLAGAALGVYLGEPLAAAYLRLTGLA